MPAKTATAPTVEIADTTWTAMDGRYEVRDFTVNGRAVHGYHLLGERVVQFCGKCGGTGHIPHYANVFGGVCFACKGFQGPQDHGTLPDFAVAETRRQKDRDARARRKAAKLAKADAAYAAWAAQHADLVAAITPYGRAAISYDAPRPDGPRHLVATLCDVAKGVAKLHPTALTDAQVELARRLLDEIAEHETARAARDAEQAAAGHYGNVGDRAEVEVEVLFTRWFEGQWGSSLLVAMRDDAGHVFKTFASGRFAGDVTRAKEDTDGPVRLVVKGTVKAHDTYEGKPETALTRCSLVRLVA